MKKGPGEMLGGEEKEEPRSPEGQGMPGRDGGGLPVWAPWASPSPEGTPWTPVAQSYLQGINRDLPQEGMLLLMKC